MFVEHHKTEQGEQLIFQGEWVMRSAKSIYEELSPLLMMDAVAIDAFKIEEIDSSGLQILISALRTRKSQGKLHNLSASSSVLDSLVQLFGLSDEIKGE